METLEDALIRFDKAAALKGHDACKYYGDWGAEYDQDYKVAKYNGPSHVAKRADKVFKVKSSKILDICTGTGLLGQEMQKYGFKHLDAHDGSPDVLEVARSKQIYKSFYCELITDKPTSIPAGAYDGVVCSGSFLTGHLPVEAVDEFLRVLKPGGHCVIGMRERWLWEAPEYRDRLEPHMFELCNKKKCKLVYCNIVANWTSDYAGKIWVFQKFQDEL